MPLGDKAFRRLIEQQMRALPPDASPQALLAFCGQLYDTLVEAGAAEDQCARYVEGVALMIYDNKTLSDTEHRALGRAVAQWCGFEDVFIDRRGEGEGGPVPDVVPRFTISDEQISAIADPYLEAPEFHTDLFGQCARLRDALITAGAIPFQLLAFVSTLADAAWTDPDHSLEERRALTVLIGEAFGYRVTFRREPDGTDTPMILPYEKIQRPPS